MLNSYNFSTSPLSQPTRKLRRLDNLALRSREPKIRRLGEIYNRRNLIKKYSEISVVKELDAETGLYYYGARYLDPRTSRWLSGDPAMGEYVPLAPINDEARKHNSNLPGLGGVFNYVNLHVYHYAGNNPVKYIDPDGRSNIDWYQVGSGVLNIAGGTVAWVVGVGGVAGTGGFSILLCVWGTKEILDGFAKIGLAGFGIEYNGSLPFIAGMLADAFGADERLRRQIETGTELGESAVGIILPGTAGRLISSGQFVLSVANLLSPSRDVSTPSSSGRPTFHSRYNTVQEKYVRYNLARAAAINPTHYDRLTLATYRMNLLQEINELIWETTSLQTKVELDRIRSSLNSMNDWN